MDERKGLPQFVIGNALTLRNLRDTIRYYQQANERNVALDQRASHSRSAANSNPPAIAVCTHTEARAYHRIGNTFSTSPCIATTAANRNGTN